MNLIRESGCLAVGVSSLQNVDHIAGAIILDANKGENILITLGTRF